MVLIESNEILLSSALSARLASDYPGIAIHPLRAGWPPKTASPTRDPRVSYPFVRGFIISEFPFNVYGIYEQIKGAARVAASKGLPLDMEILLKLGMEDVLMMKTIRRHCSYLHKLSGDLPRSNGLAPAIHFSCVYNVFGAVRDAVIQPGNNAVQGLLFLLKHAERQIVVPFGKDQEVIGTDVEQAVRAILDRGATCENEHSNGDETTGAVKTENLVALPVNIPVEAGTLVAEIARIYPGKYLTVQYVENPRLESGVVKAELGVQHSDTTLIDSFISYLAT